MKFVPVQLLLALWWPIGIAIAATPTPSPPPAPAEIPNVAQPLNGTLFFTPEQRGRIDRARKRGESINEDMTGPERASIVNGFVRRSDGKLTVWVDGKTVTDPRGRSATTLLPTDVGGGEDLKRPTILAEQDVTQTAKSPLKKTKKNKAQRVKDDTRKR
jgi:hypothetical protein